MVGQFLILIYTLDPVEDTHCIYIRILNNVTKTSGQKTVTQIATVTRQSKVKKN